MSHRANFAWLALAIVSLSLAQDAEPLSEAFLLFLAEGVEVEGEWQDPLTLSGTLTDIAALEEIPENELAALMDQPVQEIEDGDNNE